MIRNTEVVLKCFHLRCLQTFSSSELNLLSILNFHFNHCMEKFQQIKCDRRFFSVHLVVLVKLQV